MLWIPNRPIPSCLVPLFQSESKCETILMKMTVICMKMKLHAELNFIWKVSLLDSFWNKGTRELGNGLLRLSGPVFKAKLQNCEWQRMVLFDETSSLSFWEFPVINGKVNRDFWKIPYWEFLFIWLSSQGSRKFRLNGSSFRNSTICGFLGHVPNAITRFEIFGILGWMESKQSF